MQRSVAKRGDTKVSELKGASRQMYKSMSREGARGVRLDQAQRLAGTQGRETDRCSTRWNIRLPRSRPTSPASSRRWCHRRNSCRSFPASVGSRTRSRSSPVAIAASAVPLRCSSRAKAPRSRSSISRRTTTRRRRRRLIEDEGSRSDPVARRHRRQGILRGGHHRDAGAVRQDRHRRQQRRRAARAGGLDGNLRGPARTHVPHQRLRLFLPDAGGAAAPRGRARPSSTPRRSPPIAARRS